MKPKLNLGICACGRPAVKRKGNEPICARCLKIETAVMPTVHPELKERVNAKPKRKRKSKDFPVRDEEDSSNRQPGHD